MLDLRSRRFVTLGLQGSGKTVLNKHFLKTYPKHLVYDTLHEYRGFNRYLPACRQYSLRGIEELNLAVSKLVFKTKNHPELFVIDEANRFCPNKRPLPDTILQLNDWSRHMGVGFGVIARRPTQLHTDLVELAHDLFIYRLVGKNDAQYLDQIVHGLAGVVAKLEPYEFVHVDEFRNYQINKPVPVV